MSNDITAWKNISLYLYQFNYIYVQFTFDLYQRIIKSNSHVYDSRAIRSVFTYNHMVLTQIKFFGMSKLSKLLSLHDLKLYVPPWTYFAMSKMSKLLKI